MEAYLVDWLHLLIRFLHVLTAIAWIGASFYFVWLDNSLEKPPQWKIDKGIKGDLWAVHGGGFYEVAKYQNTPEQLPKTLHWFKWEAYSTWLTGMALLIVVFYVGAQSYLIDSTKADLTSWQAIGIGVGSLLAGFAVYEGACRTPLIKHNLAFGLVMLALVTFMAWALSQVLGDRAAYIHVGALIGTCMAGNVFNTIMPSQRVMVEAAAKGETPDPYYGNKAKLRSTHNNYATIPVLFIMLSNHFPMTYGHEYGWLILGALALVGAWARHFFNLRHHGKVKPMIIVSALVAFFAIAFIAMPSNVLSSGKSADLQAGTQASALPRVTDVQALNIVGQHCTACHSATPTDDIFKVSPGGVMFDNLDQIKAMKDRILARAVHTHDMPFMNKTGMTEEEREVLGRWLEQ
ncbi:urate hydroxylase PuuD [Oceanobacter kriegii]|uniref:urate hydroxylase PuuD n=1 Tax=Oceanobacter kriegii TaxID=64972 RepID=UPI00040731A6|nr:urate hydroxylase PuuD [Oceanobacter kriegii]